MNDGMELAKVLWYYNLIYDFNETEQKIICPFHPDINPSMKVNLDKNFFFCFGCDSKGNALNFVMIMEKQNGLNDLQCIRKYYQILKSKKASVIKQKKHKQKIKKTDKQLYAEAYDYYHGLNKINWMTKNNDKLLNDARKYMMRRGFSPRTLNACKLKFSYSKNYSLLFPMFDNGKFKGWVSRTMVPSVEKVRKYLYNKGFSRATTLVGNYGSKKFVIVVEGYMDRLKFIQYGEDNVVAILGWKMSEQQIEKLKKSGVTDIISALDNDKCGIKGTKHLQKHFNVTRFAYLKRIKDPGEMNEDDFRRMFSKTMSKYNGRHKKQNNIK